MLDFSSIKAICDKKASITRSFVDEFLLYYAGESEEFDKKFVHQMSNYKNAIKELPEAWLGSVMAELIAHEIFKKGGIGRQISESFRNQKTH